MSGQGTIWLDRLSQTAQLILGTIALFWAVLLFHNTILLDHESLFVGGLLSGGLHAMSGPDHLAALLPFIFGKKWYVSFAIGVTWGIGHSLSTSLMGIILYLLKDSLLKMLIVTFITKFATIFVGFSLVFIGALGLRELNQEKEQSLPIITSSSSSNNNNNNNSLTNLSYNNNSISNENNSSTNNIHFNRSNDSPSNKSPKNMLKTHGFLGDSNDKVIGDKINFGSIKSDDIEPHSGSVFRDSRALAMSQSTPCGGLLLLGSIFANGFLLGLSWDSIPSLGPSLGAADRVDLFWFLTAYSASTAFVMALMTSLISACTFVVGKYTESSETLPHRLSLISCYVSLFLGVIWMAHGMLHCFAAIDDENSQMTWYILVISTISPISIVFVIVTTVLKHFGIWGSLNFSSILNARVKQEIKSEDASCNL